MHIISNVSIKRSQVKIQNFSKINKKKGEKKLSDSNSMQSDQKPSIVKIKTDLSLAPLSLYPQSPPASSKQTENTTTLRTVLDTYENGSSNRHTIWRLGQQRRSRPIGGGAVVVANSCAAAANHSQLTQQKTIDSVFEIYDCKKKIKEKMSMPFECFYSEKIF